jgi:hypothetical protein
VPRFISLFLSRFKPFDEKRLATIIDGQINTKSVCDPQKFIKAHSAAEALRKDRVTPVDEIHLDEEWKRSGGSTAAIGFQLPFSRKDEAETAQVALSSFG